MIDFVQEFLDKEGFSTIKIPNENGIGTRMFGEDIDYSFVVWVNDDSHEIIIYSTFFFNIEKNMLSKIMELITEINYGMQIGNFELDLYDGELKFKTSTVYDSKSGLSESVLRDLVYINMSAMERYYPAIKAVIDGKSSPQKAISNIEQI